MWLLRRNFALELLSSYDSQAQAAWREYQRAMEAGDKERAQEILAVLAARLRQKPVPQRFWRPHDLRWFVWGSLSMGLVLAAHWLAGGSVMSRIVAVFLPILLGFAAVLPLGYSSLHTLLQREQIQGTSVFLRLTRLDGYDLLWGAYLGYALAGVLRWYLVIGAPIGVGILAIAHDSMPRGLSAYARTALCLGAIGLLWQTALALLATPKPRALWQALVNAFIGVAVIACFLGVPVAMGYLMHAGMVANLAKASAWAWFFQPAFWGTVFFPPLGFALCAYILNPLWGVVHAVLWAVLIALLAPLAARRLQAMLNAPELEPLPQEGAWW